jgi:SAM-dependent methyltransferase
MGAVRDFELDGWQAAASSYAGFAGATQLFVPALLQAAGIRPGIRLLDVACGPGATSAAAVTAGAHVTGVDFSPAMIDVARKSCPEADFHVADAEELPFADAAFDAVVANFGIHHVEYPERAIAQARRVLVPGGIFAFTFWADPLDNTAWRIIFDAVTACGRVDVPMPAGNNAHATPENFSRIVVAAGFDARTLRCDLITEDWRLCGDDDLVSIFETGTVRMATLLHGQGTALDKVRARVADGLRSYRQGQAIVLPTRAWLLGAEAE